MAKSSYLIEIKNKDKLLFTIWTIFLLKKKNENQRNFILKKGVFNFKPLNNPTKFIVLIEEKFKIVSVLQISESCKYFDWDVN